MNRAAKKFLWIAILALSGCVQSKIVDGQLECAPDPARPCPAGFYCASGLCYQKGHIPPTTPDMNIASDMSTSNPDVGTQIDLAAPPGPDMSLPPTAGALSVDNKSLDYSTIDTGTSSASQTVMVSNSGQTATGPLSFTLMGANKDEFAVPVDTCTGSSLAANSSCAISVAFAPTSYGQKSAGLVISSTPGGVASVVLGGIGRETFQVTTALSGNGSGVVSGGTINCPGTCSQQFQVTTTPASVTLTATPNASSVFGGWSGGGCSGTGTCAVSVGASQTVTALFSLKTVAVNVTTQFIGFGFGSISLSTPSTTPSASCGSNCTTYTYDYGTALTITAFGQPLFQSWSGDCQSTGTATSANGTCSLTMTATRNVLVKFRQSSNYAFVTSGLFRPGIDVKPQGYATAAAICQAAASAAQLSGTYAAWIGATGYAASGSPPPPTYPGNAFKNSTVGYIRTDGANVAPSYSSLTSGTILSPISFDEFGVDQSGSANVLAMTGTATTAGLYNSGGNDCSAWSATSTGNTETGNIKQTNSTWNVYVNDGCSLSYRLYCFEQDF